ETLRNAIWLLFLETEHLEREIFDDINMPFDCEFLVAKLQDGGGVVLNEVYRLGPTLPLNVCNLGNWSERAGSSWSTTSLYQRRNSLQGLVLKTGTMRVGLSQSSGQNVRGSSQEWNLDWTDRDGAETEVQAAAVGLVWDTNRALAVDFIEPIEQVSGLFKWLQDSSQLLPVRVIHLTTYLAAVVIATSYSVSLLSDIMTKVYKLPFRDFLEFLDDGSYQLGVLHQSAHLSYFNTSNNTMLQTIYQKHIAPYKATLPDSMQEGLELVCTQQRYAAMSYSRVLTSFKNLKCSVQKIPNAYISVIKSLAICKNSPYLGILKHT
ncbi:hypothetical protein ANN_25385, partial [Periplaneta americana]